MKKLLALSFLLTAMSWAQSPPPQASAAGDTNLVFSDDFNTFSFCPTGNGTGCTWYNSGMWWNGIPPEGNSTVSGGNLQLLWVRGQSPSPNDTSISTCARTGAPCKTFNHGYVEASMRWDVVTGSWPAFWMIPVEGHSNQQPQGEWDIMEAQGANNYTATAHQWNTSTGNIQCGKQYFPASGVNLSNYHTYGMLWTPGTIKFYFDNNLVNTCSIGSTVDAQHYFIILGSQEGVNWSYGNLTGVTVNQIAANFDWVHVWQSGGSSTQPPAAPSGLTATVS